MAVGAFLDNGQHIPLDQIFRYGTPMLMVMELTLVKIEEGIVGFDVKHFWQFKPCKDIKDKHLTEDFLNPSKSNKATSDFIGKYMLCPDITKPEDMYLLSNQGSPPYRKMDINIYPCMIPDTSLCAPREEIERLSWKIAFGRSAYDPSMKYNPITKSIYFEDIRVVIAKEIEYKVSLMGVEIHNQDKDFTKDYLVAEHLKEIENLATSGLRDPSITCTL